MSKIHDTGYKRLFSNKTIFQELIETFVKDDWVSKLDFESCERIDKSFISEHYKETESDIVYKVKLNEKDAYICILMEFQSTIEHFMAVRVLNYITNFYMDFIASHKRLKKLPAVFPIVLYNGDRNWTPPERVEELIENQAIIGEFGLHGRYFKIAE